MRRLRKLLSLAGIWLTAFMTPVAGAPHLHCVCPDGRVKLYCLSFFSRTSCCDGSCCAAFAQDDNPPQEQAACCCRAAGQTDSRDHRIHGSGCKKTLIDAEASGAATPTRDAGSGPDTSACVVLTEPSALASISPTNAERIRRNHHRPPPPDLLSLLQHFNI